MSSASTSCAAKMQQSTNLITEAEDAAPPAQDEGVVRGEDGDLIDALRLQLVDLGEVRRRVVCVARRLEYDGSALIDQHSCTDWRVKRRTVKAPGTAKIRTFLPFHASVETFVAVVREGIVSDALYDDHPAI